MHTRLAGLAQAWRAAGAAHFSLWEGERCVFAWPDSRRPSPAWSAAVGPEAALWVAGEGLAGAEARLRADAALLSDLLHLESELEAMTSELVDSQDQLVAWYGLAQSTRRQVSLEAALPALAAELAHLLKAEAALVALAVEGAPLRVAGHAPEPLVAELADLPVKAWLGRLRAVGRSVILPAGDASLPAPWRNALLALVRVHDRAEGLLVVLNAQHDAFHSPDLKLAEAIAHQAGAQLESILHLAERLAQARLQTELELAKSVQRQLLPSRPPRLPGLQVFAASQPALEVGGDFYDYIPRRNRPPMVVLGDVTGKGMPAALVMAMLHTTLRNQAARPIADLAELMAEINATVYDELSELGVFATLFVCEHAPETRRLTYVNGGHSPVVYCPAGGPAQLLVADGTALGVLPHSLCAAHTLTLGPGDVLVIATDGFSEARRERDDEMFGYDQFLALVAAQAGGSAEAIAQALLGALAAFSGSRPQDDDQTLIVLKGCA